MEEWGDREQNLQFFGFPINQENLLLYLSGNHLSITLHLVPAFPLPETAPVCSGSTSQCPQQLQSL